MFIKPVDRQFIWLFDLNDRRNGHVLIKPVGSYLDVLFHLNDRRINRVCILSNLRTSESVSARMSHYLEQRERGGMSH